MPTCMIMILEFRCSSHVLRLQSDERRRGADSLMSFNKHTQANSEEIDQPQTAVPSQCRHSLQIDEIVIPSFRPFEKEFFAEVENCLQKVV